VFTSWENYAVLQVLGDATCTYINSTHYAKLYPRNGDRIVTTDSVTSPGVMYAKHGTGSLGHRHCSRKRVQQLKKRQVMFFEI